MQQTLQVRFPSANLEVKTMLPVRFLDRLLRVRCRRDWIRLRESLNWLQGDNQAAQ
jgi:hypothetical protein